MGAIRRWTLFLEILFRRVWNGTRNSYSQATGPPLKSGRRMLLCSLLRRRVRAFRNFVNSCVQYSTVCLWDDCSQAQSEISKWAEISKTKSTPCLFFFRSLMSKSRIEARAPPVPCYPHIVLRYRFSCVVFRNSPSPLPCTCAF